jgi:filamentous hemagglutinin
MNKSCFRVVYTGFSVGVSNSNGSQNTASQTQSGVRSQIVSTNGNVTVDANKNVTVQGSDLTAAKDLSVIGQNVYLDPGADATQTSTSQSSSQYGMTLALGGVTGNALATVNQNTAPASHAGNARLAALDDTQAALSAYGAAQAVAAGATNSPALFKATVSVGGGSSTSESQSQTVVNQGSTLTAGGTVSVVATGSGVTDANGKPADGDIDARGTQITGQNVSLNASRDINLTSAQDLTHDTSSNSSSNASLGVGFGLGGTQNGFTLEAAAGGAKGDANGNSVTNQNTQIQANNTVTLTSGRDTTLQGAQVAGGTVDANVGGNLTIQSPQDTNTYKSQQTSFGAQVSVCVPPFCYGQTVSASGNVSDQSVKDNFQSVNQQSGIYAGSGGYNVNVGNHTQLDGGVIASTATPDKNTLSTQTLGYMNLQNSSDYSGSTFGFSGTVAAGQSTPDGVSFANPATQGGSNTPGATNVRNAGPTGFGAAGVSSQSSGTTYAAVSSGTITVRGDAGTGQDSTAGLSRNTATANGSVQNTFNAQNVTNDMAIQQQVGQVGMQGAGDVADSIQKSAQQQMAQASQAYQTASAANDAAGMAQAQSDYNAAVQENSLWSNDGAARIAAHGVVAAVGAAAGGGNVSGAVAGTVAGDVAGNAATGALGNGANTIGGTLISNIASGVAGAVAGGAVGGAGGALSGANGGLTADEFNRQLHPQEKTAAQQIAANAAAQGIKNPDGSPITAGQIDNAMRAANNSQYGEIAATGVVVPLNANTPANALYDTTGMQFASDSAGNNYEVQDPSMLATPSQTLQNLIQQNTGGANSPYSWNPPSQTISPTSSPSATGLAQTAVYQAGDGGYRQTINVGGESFNIGLSGPCATVECVANGANIDWSDPGSKALQTAMNVQLAEAVANGAAVVSLISPTGFAAQFATYLGATADGSKAYITGDRSALAPDIVGVPLGIVLTGLGVPEGAATRVNTLYQQFLGGWFSNSGAKK